MKERKKRARGVAINHPINLIVHQVGPALAAGCLVLVKPSKDTPLSCRMLVDLLIEVGLPAAWCQVLVSSQSQAEWRLNRQLQRTKSSTKNPRGISWLTRPELHRLFVRVGIPDIT